MSEKSLRLLVVAYVVTIVVLLIVTVIGDRYAIPVVGPIVGLLFIVVLFSGLFAIPIYAVKVRFSRAKERARERREAILQEHSGEEVLGCIRARRRVGSILHYSIIREVLVIAPDKVVVAETRTETPQFGGGGTIDHSHKKFALPESEITEMELSKLLQVTLKITTREREYKWWVKGFVPEKKGVKLEDYENVLRPIFGDKLSVKN